MAWLLCAQAGELDDETPEPPVPPSLGALTAPLKAFAEFLRLDQDLLAAAAAGSPAQAEARRRREAEREARERMRREQEAAAAREKRLAILAKREPDAWRQVDALIATKRPSHYDAAVCLLKDLADLGEKRGRQAEVRDRLARLRQEHARKPTLLTRLKAAGLLAD